MVIPTIGRSKSLQRCLESLDKQTVKPYEIILKREKGELAKIRNSGASDSKGDIVSFIDDDTVCEPYWCEQIIKTFEEKKVQGVSGISFIPKSYRKNRDIFRHRFFKFLYDSFFCNGESWRPGHLTRSGAWTTGACNIHCSYEGKVDFLEACNMSFDIRWFRFLRGFNENYGGCGDWSEPDLCNRIRELDGVLWFNPKVKLYHCPDADGAYKGMNKQSKGRLDNYLMFSKRWIKPYWKHGIYKLFLKGYYSWKYLLAS